jgi:hypothetical protein
MWTNIKITKSRRNSLKFFHFYTLLCGKEVKEVIHKNFKSEKIFYLGIKFSVEEEWKHSTKMLHFQELKRKFMYF